MAKKKGITSKAKKKEAIANAVIKKGTGIVRINKKKLSTIEPEHIQEFIKEPLELAGDIANTVDISVVVKGGGVVSQAVASRASIAKVIIKLKHDEKLKKKFLAYDRMLLVDDARRVEPKKQLGPKARAKKQTSKR